MTTRQILDRITAIRTDLNGLALPIDTLIVKTASELLKGKNSDNLDITAWRRAKPMNVIVAAFDTEEAKGSGQVNHISIYPEETNLYSLGIDSFNSMVEADNSEISVLDSAYILEALEAIRLDVKDGLWKVDDNGNVIPADKEIILKDFFTMPFVEDLHDSMELESGDIVVSSHATVGNLSIEASVVVHGDVRVIFRDHVYRNAGRMPKELLKCYHDGTDPTEAALSDGGNYETPYYCDMNNWLEESIIVRDSENNIVDDSFNEVIDVIDDNTPDGWKKMILEDIASLIKEL